MSVSDKDGRAKGSKLHQICVMSFFKACTKLQSQRRYGRKICRNLATFRLELIQVLNGSMQKSYGGVVSHHVISKGQMSLEKSEKDQDRMNVKYAIRIKLLYKTNMNE